MADGLGFLITDEEKGDIENILEGGDYRPNDWEQQFLSDMSIKEYITIKQREKLDQVLAKFGFK